ncbi:MAG: NAD kinase [Tannerellaceae bacterium]|jgi:NAD+ kinase|nr:NAD kinase [Tannerellaceae bacterium]
MERCRKIGIFGGEGDKAKECVNKIVSKLRNMGVETLLDEDLQGGIENCGLDIGLSVGGDGTFLKTVAKVNKKNIPILGVNTGNLGFLADVKVEFVEIVLESVLSGKFTIEERVILRLSTEKRFFRGFNYALNEIAILKRDSSAMITIDTWLDNEFFTSYRADGLIVATPTGSTAYSMSAGGPIVSPLCACTLLAPVAAHSLSVRPLVVPDLTTIKLKVTSRSDTFLIALDGRSEVFPAGMELQIDKAAFSAKVVKPLGMSFYKTLREKLGWSANAANS